MFCDEMVHFLVMEPPIIGLIGIYISVYEINNKEWIKPIQSYDTRHNATE